MQYLRAILLTFSFGALVSLTGCAPEAEPLPAESTADQVQEIPGDTAMREGSVNANAPATPE